MYAIIVETKNETFKAFTWTRDKKSGIARAERECKDRGIEWIAIYAVG